MRPWRRQISDFRFLPTLWLKGWHSSPSTPLGTHILRPLSHRLTAQQKPNPHCTSLSQACRRDRQKKNKRGRRSDEGSSFNAREWVLFCSALIETSSHVCTVRDISSIACHLPNPFTNEYQSEDWDNFLSFFFQPAWSGGGCGLLSLKCNQILDNYPENWTTLFAYIAPFMGTFIVWMCDQKWSVKGWYYVKQCVCNGLSASTAHFSMHRQHLC